MDLESRKIRYSIEPWGKPPENVEDEPTIPGIRKSRDNYGYTDELLVVSILHDENGEPCSIALFDTESGYGQPSRKLLELVKEQIEHHLERHLPQYEGVTDATISE